MQTIKIEIKKRHAKAVGAPVLVCSNKNNSEIVFIFDEEWAAEEEKTARFIYDKAGKTVYQDVPFRGDTVKVPLFSGVRSVRVGVYAGDLITTTAAYISCDPSILCGGGEEILKTPNPLEYATFLNNAFQGAQVPSGYSLTLDLPRVVQLSGLVKGVTALGKITLKGNNEGISLNFDEVFANCSSLEVVDCTEFPLIPSTANACFYYCAYLREIKGVIDMSRCTKANAVFDGCVRLEELRFKPLTLRGLSLTASPLLSAETRQSIVEALSPYGGVLTLHSAVVAKFTPEQLTEIFNKKWSLE